MVSSVGDGSLMGFLGGLLSSFVWTKFKLQEIRNSAVVGRDQWLAQTGELRTIEAPIMAECRISAEPRPIFSWLPLRSGKLAPVS